MKKILVGSRWVKPSDYIRKGWTQNAMARTALGRVVDTRSRGAVRWCLVGAIEKSARDTQHRQEMYDKVRAKLDSIPSLLFDGLAFWQDVPSRTQQEVIDLLESVGL